MTLRSTYQVIGLPDDFGPILLTLCVILLLSPYASGADFGILKIPVFPLSARRRLKVLGPVVMAAAILLFVPVWREEAPVGNAANASDSTQVVPPGPDTSKRGQDTASDTTEGVVAPPPLPPPPPPPSPPPSPPPNSTRGDPQTDSTKKVPPPLCIWLARPGVRDLVEGLIQHKLGESYESDVEWIVRARALVHSAPAIVPREMPHMARARIDNREVQRETISSIAETLHDAVVELQTFHMVQC